MQKAASRRAAEIHFLLTRRRCQASKGARTGNPAQLRNLSGLPGGQQAGAFG